MVNMTLTSPAATLIIWGVKFAPEAQATNSPAHQSKNIMFQKGIQNYQENVRFEYFHMFCSFSFKKDLGCQTRIMPNLLLEEWVKFYNCSCGGENTKGKNKEEQSEEVTVAEPTTVADHVAVISLPLCGEFN
jgi:hypothetical protein